jgi:hypothetical protein
VLTLAKMSSEQIRRGLDRLNKIALKKRTQNEKEGSTKENSDNNMKAPIKKKAETNNEGPIKKMRKFDDKHESKAKNKNESKSNDVNIKTSDGKLIGKNNIYKTILEYKACNRDELSYKTGDKIVIKDKGHGDGWVNGENYETKVKGMIAASALGSKVATIHGQPWNTEICRSGDGRDLILLQDLVTLEKGTFLTDNIVHFMINRIHNNLSKNIAEKVLVITDPMQLLEKGEHERVAEHLILNSVGAEDGPEMIIAPYCEKGHFFLFIIHLKSKRFFVL